MDGTLIDTVGAHAQAWKESFEYFGRELPLSLVRSQIGKGGDQLMPVFLTEDEIARFGEDLSAYRSEHWKRNYLPHIKAFPGVRELFLRLRQDGKRIAIASSSQEEELRIYMKVAGIADLVDVEVSASDVSSSKPAPDLFLETMKKLELDSTEEIAVVGDSPFDMIAAEQIGLCMIGVRCGGFSDSELREAGAQELYNDPYDLLQHYDTSMIGRRVQEQV